MTSARLVLLGAALLLVLSRNAQAQMLLERARGGCPTPGGLSAAAASNTAITLSWQPADGAQLGSCSSYLIAVYKEGQPDSTGKTFKSKVPAAIISGLSPLDSYTVQVRAINRLGVAASEPAQLSGVATSPPSLTSTLTVARSEGNNDGWACVAAQGYPACAAGNAGLCTPITCADMARLGRCGAPYIRVQDWQRRTVTQYCAAECGGCAGKAVPRLADSMAPPQEYCCAFGNGAYFEGPNGQALSV